MNYDIILTPYNQLYYKINADSRLLNKIKNYFSMRAPGFIFNPLYKNGLWNGFVCLIKTDLLPAGLLNDLEKYATDNNLKLFINKNTNELEISDSYLEEIISSTKLSDINKKTKEVFPITLRDYQKEAVKLCVNNKHQLIVSNTSTGKTLMMYMVVRILQQAVIFDKKMLMIVPSISLVDQMYNDFINYSKLNNWDVEKYCTRMHSKIKPDYNKQILITTWQSLMEKPDSFFKEYEVVFLDEAHKISKSNTKESKQIEREINLCVNAKYLLGFTGTLPDELLYKKKIEGFFGNMNTVTTYNDAIESGYICNLQVNALQLNYVTGFEGKLRDYKHEKSYIMSSDYRNKFIMNLLLKAKGNQLLLFTEIKKHAKVIFDLISKDDRFKDYKIILLDSSSSSTIREETKKILETNNNVIIFGTYALLGTGWSVNNIWNVIFVAPLKSKIAILQSIGRGLRLLPGEDKVCKIWDIVDRFEYKNILYKHFEQRCKYYKENNFTYKIYNFENKPKSLFERV